MHDKYLVCATQPFVVTHGDDAGRTCDDSIRATLDDHAEAQIVAKALHAQGWTVTIRMWSRQQRRVQDRLGRWRWRAGYVELSIDWVATPATPKAARNGSARPS